MHANTEVVHPPPGKCDNHGADDSTLVDAQLLDNTTHFRMQRNDHPKTNEQCAIFLGIPAPETSPGIVGLYTTEYGTHRCKKQTETEDAIAHAGETTIKISIILFIAQEATNDVDV